MNDYIMGHVSYLDDQREQLVHSLTDLKAINERIINERNFLRTRLDNLLETNARQIACYDHLIKEAGDDETRHYLESCRTELFVSRASIEALMEEVNRT